MTQEIPSICSMSTSPVPITATWVRSYLVPRTYQFDTEALDRKTDWSDLVCDEGVSGRVDGEQKEIIRLLRVYDHPLGVIEYDATKTHVGQRGRFAVCEFDVSQQRVIFVRFAKPRPNGDIGVFIVAWRWSVPSSFTRDSRAWLLSP